MKYLYWVLVFIVLPVYVQARIPSTNLGNNYNFAVHFTSPIGLGTKAGFKLEVRGGNTSLLVGITHYHDTFPGNQFSIEGRKYLDRDRGIRGQTYGYVKGIGGHQNQVLHDKVIAPECDYYGLGIGLGRHISSRHFFLDFNGGAKYVGLVHPPIDARFYISGPGAVVDLHLNLGFQANDPANNYTHFNDSSYTSHRKHCITTRIGEGILIGGGALLVTGVAGIAFTKDGGLGAGLALFGGEVLGGIGGIVFAAGKSYDKNHKARFTLISKGKRVGLAYNF